MAASSPASDICCCQVLSVHVVNREGGYTDQPAAWDKGAE